MIQHYFNVKTLIPKYILSNHLVIIAFITLLWLLNTGYSCMRSDCHDFYVPIIKYFMNSKLYVNDPFIFHASTKPYLFYRLLAIGSHYINLQVLMFIILLLSNFVLLYSTYRLSILLTKNKNVAFTSVFLMMFISGGTLAFSYPQQVVHAMTFVTPFLFLAIVYYLQKDVKFSLLITGLMFNFHPISSLLLLFLIGFNLFLTERNYLRQLLSYCLSFTIPAIPTIIQLIQNSPIANYKEYQLLWLKIVGIRSPHHLFPFDWPINIWIPLIFFVLLTLIGFQSFKIVKMKKKILYFWIGIGGMSLGALIFSETIPVVPFIQLTLFRSTVFFKFLAIPFVAYFLCGKLSKNYTYIIIFGILLFLFFLYPLPTFDFYLTLFFIITQLFDRKILYHPLVISILTSFVLIMFFPLITKHIRPRFFTIFYFIDIILMVLMLLKRKILFIILGRIKYIHWLYILILVAVLFSFSVKNQISIDIYENLDNYNSIRQIAFAINKLTLPSSIIIIPPYEYGFQADTERTIVGDWKLGGLAIWDLPYSVIWWNRMVSLSGNGLNYCNSYDQCLTTLKKGYDSLTMDQFVKLAKEYQASFIVSHNRGLSLPKFIENTDYVVYDVRNLKPTNTL